MAHTGLSVTLGGGGTPEKASEQASGTELCLSKSLLYVLRPWDYSDFYQLKFCLVIPERDHNLI